MKLIISLFTLFILWSQVFGELINKKVDRTIDLTSFLAKHSLTIQLHNPETSAVKTFDLAFRVDQALHLSYLQVTHEGVTLSTTLVESKKSEYVLHRVTLAKALSGGSTFTIKAYAVFTHLIEAYPKAIYQHEKQSVRYSDNHFFFSPYQTTSQTTNVKLSSSTIENYSEEPPTSVKGDTITYGPYNDVAPFSYDELSVHFESNKPFITVRSLVKEIEVSHWGNVAVEETYFLEHSGAALKGTFSRFDYQRNPNGSPSIIAKYSQILPVGASDVYYRDEIGNITSSNLRLLDNGKSLLELVPRFPLFGGWKFGFYMGYNLPSNLYLFRDYQDSSLFMLNTTFAVDFEDAVIDHLIVRVILPEGAKNIEYFVPFPIDSQSNSLHFTYLDTSGRPVLILEKKNVVSAHNQFFQVTYNFSSTTLLREPFLLVGAFFLFFLAFMIYFRLEFSIGPKTRQLDPKCADALEQFKDIMNSRANNYADFDQELNRVVKSKDLNAYNSKKVQIEKLLDQSSKELSKVIQILDELELELSKKVKNIENKDQKRRATQSQLHKLELDERVSKSKPSSSYEKSKAKLEHTYQDLDAEIGDLMADLTDNL